MAIENHDCYANLYNMEADHMVKELVAIATGVAIFLILAWNATRS
jgi:hypothetical protein